jgi:proteic killer suppression protein
VTGSNLSPLVRFVVWRVSGWSARRGRISGLLWVCSTVERIGLAARLSGFLPNFRLPNVSLSDTFNVMPIRSYRDKVTEAVAGGECPKGFPADLVKVARRKLRVIEAATELWDLKSPPGNRLHPLDKDRAGQHAIWVNDRVRVCFVWRDGGAERVEIIDYH